VKGREFLGHPVGLYVCFFTEMGERFSFYGMKALLLLYLTKYHLFADKDGYALLGAYGGLVYAMPVIGGLLADRYLGMRKAVLLGGSLLVLGHFGMAFEGHKATIVEGVVNQDHNALQIFYLSLALIIMGVGFLKPNISTIVGKLYPEGDPRRDSGFTIFYAGINIGAGLSAALCGYLGETYGWKYGFGTAGAFMVLSLTVFAVFQKHLHGHAEPTRPELLTEKVLGPINRQLAIILGAIGGVFLVWQLIQRTSWVHTVMNGVGVIFLAWFVWFLATRCTRNERHKMTALIFIILANLIFFALYEQTYGSWVTLTDRLMDRTLFFGITPTASQYTSVGAVLLVGLSPFFAWLWPFLAKRGLNPSTGMKAAIGLAFGGLAFIPLALATKASGGHLVTVWWLIGAYAVLEIGELSLSPIGLSAVTQLSVKRVVSLMMGAWFLATAYSEVLAGWFGALTATGDSPGEKLDLVAAAAQYGNVFWWMVGIGLTSAIIFVGLTPLMNRWMNPKEDPAATPLPEDKAPEAA